MIEAKDPAALTSAVFDVWRIADKETRLEVHGWSMRPLIGHGDSVVVKHTLEGIGPGSIVALRWGHRIIIHRVLRRIRVKGEDVYLSKGDANPRRDPLMRQRAVLGRVVEVIRNNKTINVESTLWRNIGYLMVIWGAVSSVLPKWSLELKFFRIFKRLVARIV